MKRFSQQFNTAANRVRLTKAESQDLRERLVSYMEYHPLPAEQRTPAKTTLASEPFWIWRFNTVRTRALFSVSAMALLIIVPIAAEQTVPGDVLYPVKVRFNEEVRSSLAVTPYQQIEWETKRVERRLAEARLLATEGKLTEAIEAEVAAAVKTHGDAAQAGLAELRASDSEAAAIAELTFASALEVESEVLATETERQQAAGASTTVALAAAIADVRAQVATPETTEVSFARLVAQVESETTRANELLLSLINEVTPAEREDIDRRLADIDRKFTEALTYQATTTETVVEEITDVVAEVATSTATSTDEVTTAVIKTPTPAAITEAEAKTLLREALQDTQKLIRFMTDIDVKNNVTVDELIPMTLTATEWQQTLAVTRTEITNGVSELEARNSADEKITFGLERVAELLVSADSATEATEFTAAEQTLTEALALVTDMLRATDALAVPGGTPVVDEVATSTATSSEPVVEEATDEETIEPATTEEEAAVSETAPETNTSETEVTETTAEETVIDAETEEPEV